MKQQTNNNLQQGTTHKVLKSLFLKIIKFHQYSSAVKEVHKTHHKLKYRPKGAPIVIEFAAINHSQISLYSRLLIFVKQKIKKKHNSKQDTNIVFKVILGTRTPYQTQSILYLIKTIIANKIDQELNL